MDPALISLLAATIAFVGTHFAMSHPLREPMVRMLGEKGFLGIYSLVSLAAFAWMIIAFIAAPPGQTELWDGSGPVIWAIASLLTLLALILFLGSLIGNPALPDTPEEKVVARKPDGIFRVTRHPMMWGFALWAIAHMLVMPDARMLIFAGGFAVLALLGAHLQDRKKEFLMPQAWPGWEAQTSYWPQLGQFVRIGPALWIAGIAVWLAATWAHLWLGAIAAGVWRWLG